MDFMRILRSFEEFIFEATTLLLFYPRIMWRIIRRPLATMDYSDREQGDVEEKRYDDALSPPLVLLITIVLVNLLGTALHVPPPSEASAFSKTVLNSQQNLILFRSLVFSLTPLIAASTLLKRQGQVVTRETMRAPFYAQCYLAAPCAAFISVGGVIFQREELPNAIGLAFVVLGTAWFLTVQTRWFKSRLGVSTLDAAATATWAMIRAFIYLAVLLVVLVIPIQLL